MDIPLELAPAQLLAEADSAYRALQLDAALAAYRQAADAYPQSYEAQLGLARTLSRMRQRGQALEACDHCVEIDPTRYEAYATRAMLHFLADELDDAETCSRSALERADGEPEPWLTLAQIACDRRAFPLADQHIREARLRIEALPPGPERDESSAMAWHVETYRHLLADDLEQARQAAQQVIELEEASPYAAALAYSNLGILETRQRHYDQAIDYLERAHATNPHLHRAAGALGRVLIIRGNYEKAAEVLAQVLQHPEGESGESHYAYAAALAHIGRIGEATTHYREALSRGLTWPMRILALWHLLWLNRVARAALVALCVLLFLAWVAFGQPSQQAITLVVMIAVLVALQKYVFRRR
ncbi:MAG: tetratricopeptide repeat protein [Chloroflexi bacterium]|nr:tetratricopeptide repeat protein [Chloroflexota bacterium]